MQFVSLAIRATFGHDFPERDGVFLERVLPSLNAPVSLSSYELQETRRNSSALGHHAGSAIVNKILFLPARIGESFLCLLGTLGLWAVFSCASLASCLLLPQSSAEGFVQYLFHRL